MCRVEVAIPASTARSRGSSLLVRSHRAINAMQRASVAYIAIRWRVEPRNPQILCRIATNGDLLTSLHPARRGTVATPRISAATAPPVSTA